MTALLAGMVGITIADQAVKHFVRQQLHGRRISLGRIGHLHLVAHSLWLNRITPPPRATTVAVLFVLAALPLAVLSIALPPSSVFAGMVLGGALSNCIESITRGSVTDYVCLRFWPAFNLADVGLTAGSVGIAMQLWSL